jgi:hypothetical protein
MEEAVKLIKDLVQKIESRPGFNCVKIKLYSAFHEPFDVLVYEIEFENLDQYKKVSEEVECLPVFKEFLNTWSTLIKGGGVNELWEER